VTPAPPPGDTDIAIVGAGPVGLLLALLLGRGGWRVEVLERQATAYGRPRAVHLDHEAARILQHAGIMDRLAPQTEVMDSYLWRNAAGTTLLWLDGQPDVPTVSGWPTSTMFHQPDLERLLAEAAASQPGVRVRAGYDVRDVGPGEGDGEGDGDGDGEDVGGMALTGPATAVRASPRTRALPRGRPATRTPASGSAAARPSPPRRSSQRPS
jgi:2-polyprenyl-6-methoxyphenol hydroxylase-like FAD-dependent oxidoreductase